MKQYYGNYLGVVVTGGEKDPEGRGRCQVFVPHIMPTLYDGWNKEGQDIKFDIIGEGLPTGLNPEIVGRLQRTLPWAECAAPIIGASPSVKNGSEAYRNVGTAQPTGQMPSRAEAITGTGGFSGVIATTGNTGRGSGAHLDVRWKDGRRITTAEINKYILVDGKPPTSFGVTSGYGPRVPPVNGASAFHKGIDFGTPANLPITLTGGASFGQARDPSTTGGGGNVAEINTPEGTLQLLHLNSVTGQANLGENPSSIAQSSGINLKQDGSDGGFAALPDSIESKIDENSKAALTNVANRHGLDPNAIAMLVNTESGWNTSTTSPGGTYRGATQIGEQTFREAGGTLGGLTWNQFTNAPISQQVNVYGAWLDHYKFGSKINSAGINLANLTTAQQAALLQGFQFSPNGTSWLNAFGRGDGSVPSTGTKQAERLGDKSVNAMTDYYAQLYGSNEIAQIARSNVVVQNPTPYQMQSGPPTNNQARGMFGYASEGTTVWVFFREGDPHFPVYFAASYGQREWQNLYQYSSPGVGAGVGPGGAIPGTEVCDMRLYGGGQRSVQISDESGQEPDFIHQIYSTNGSNLTFMKDHTEFNSIYDHVNRVLGDHQDITESNRETRIRGDYNTYAEQDVYVTVGNWSDEAVAASDEIQEYINEAMKIKSSYGSSSGGGNSSGSSSSQQPTVVLEGSRKATPEEIAKVNQAGASITNPTGRYALIGTDGSIIGYTNDRPPNA